MMELRPSWCNPCGSTMLPIGCSCWVCTLTQKSSWTLILSWNVRKLQNVWFLYSTHMQPLYLVELQHFEFQNSLHPDMTYWWKSKGGVRINFHTFTGSSAAWWFRLERCLIVQGDKLKWASAMCDCMVDQSATIAFVWAQFKDIHG